MENDIWAWFFAGSTAAVAAWLWRENQRIDHDMSDGRSWLDVPTLIGAGGIVGGGVATFAQSPNITTIAGAVVGVASMAGGAWLVWWNRRNIENERRTKAENDEQLRFDREQLEIERQRVEIHRQSREAEIADLKAQVADLQAEKHDLANEVKELKRSLYKFMKVEQVRDESIHSTLSKQGAAMTAAGMDSGDDLTPEPLKPHNGDPDSDTHEHKQIGPGDTGEFEAAK